MLFRSIPLFYETILLALALYKAIQLWKESFEGTGATLVTIMIRDQIIYFVAYVTNYDNTR